MPNSESRLPEIWPIFGEISGPSLARTKKNVFSIALGSPSTGDNIRHAVRQDQEDQHQRPLDNAVNRLDKYMICKQR